MDFIDSTAVVSEDRKYRYRLTRSWKRNGDYCTWIMLNPSTADASVNDPTIMKCCRFSEAWGYAGINVVNLFAFRATDFRDMMRAEDPIGPDNDFNLMKTVLTSRRIICAWGNHGRFMGRDQLVLQSLREAKLEIHCLKLNEPKIIPGGELPGCPAHPLYQRGDCKPERFYYFSTQVS